MEITRNAIDGCMELTITGRLDSYWADHLDTGLTEAVREGHHRLRLNLSGVTFISSAGIAVLMLLGAIPAWPHSRSWGYGPSGGLGLVLLILVILMLSGRL